MAACRPADDDQSHLTALLNTFSVDYGTTGIRVSHRLSRLGDDPDPYSPSCSVCNSLAA